MEVFKDALGREWMPRVTGLTFVLVEKRTGKTFGEITAAVQSKDLVAGMHVAFAACNKQATEHNLSFEQFVEGLETDEQMGTMFEALCKALERFFQSGSASSNASNAPAARGNGKTSTK